MKVILVNQGRTSWDDEGRLQGTIDLPLSERGRKEVAALARQLLPERPKAVYCGTGRTQVETAELLRRSLGCGLRRYDGLNALDHGLWQGERRETLSRRYRRSFARWQRDPRTVAPPRGESIDEMLARVAQVVEIVRRRRDGRTLVMVLPDIVRHAVEALLRGVRLETLWSDGVSQAGRIGIEIAL